jgi:hypothetical protein
MSQILLMLKPEADQLNPFPTSVFVNFDISV